MPDTQRLRREWREPEAMDVPPDMADAIGGHRLVAERLARRGITTPAAAQRFLSAAAYSPAPASDLPDIDRAVTRLRRAISDREQILIWGDFDVDGQTSTALLYETLSAYGANVHYHVPNRFSEGHGIHLPTLKRYLSNGIDLILTCDTGVTAHDAVDCAAGRGVDTIITDHHALPEKLPAAVAVVNPQRLPEDHPLRELPGVGVAHQLKVALHGSQMADSTLDLVALGIVSDVMVQVDDTRYLLQRGLDILRQNRRPGLRAILANAEIGASELNEGHIGFAIAPRLNALGRLADANPAVELLTTKDEAKARVLAKTLESHNAKRKFLTNQVYESARAQIEAEPSLLEYAALVLCHSDWHSGVIGIVASRLVEEFGRPTVLIATPDATGHGSARSLAGLDINAAFGQVAEHLYRFGGHSMAAGLSLPAESVFGFRRALSGVLRTQGGAAPATPTVDIDGYLSLSDISLDLTRDLERLAPFGNGNPPLTLATRDLRVKRRKGLGRRREHLQLEVEDEAGRSQRVIWWRGAGQAPPSGRFDLAYTLRTSVFKGEREALLEWLDYRHDESAAVALGGSEPAYEIIDHRRSAEPTADLARMRARYGEAVIWAEVDKPEDAVDRLNLRAAETLIVWTIPPSAELWAAALAAVNPARLIVFSARPELERRAKFLTRLAALVKYAVNHRGGEAGLEELAAALAQRERAALVGLQLLRALGLLDFAVRSSGLIRLRLASGQAGDKAPTLEKRLDLLLQETRAYRDYWRTMPL